MRIGKGFGWIRGNENFNDYEYINPVYAKSNEKQ